MLQIMSILSICLFTSGQSYTFPVFGTKRYHRASNVGLLPSQISPSSLVSTNSIAPSYTNTQSQYYDEQPIYALAPNYQHTFDGDDVGHSNIINDDEYYYPSSLVGSSYPSKSSHEYHTYGMPTYRGEYKPSPYYYAPGPSYSYYDDREISNNPLDDLHEEMLQEDERERQRELYPVIGQENWYGTANSRKQDAYTKNFLRNLIEYNRQMEAQQQQELEQQQLQRDQENVYNDYADINPPEYEYDQPNENHYDLMNRFERQQKLMQNDENNEDNDDENVKQLKILANSKEQQQAKKKQNKNKTNNSKGNRNRNSNKISKNKNKNRQENIENFNHHEKSFSNWQQISPSSIPVFNQYDMVEPSEYQENEEDEWINWERKRNNNDQIVLTFPNNDESIKAFSDRKPSPVVEHLSTKKPTPTTTTTTTTSKPTSNGFSGQKEFVLPRPATPVKHLFSQPVLDMIDSGIEFADKQDQQQTTLNTHQQTQTNAVADAQQQQIDIENAASVSSKDSSKANANIYDTIKQLIAMKEQLEKNPVASTLQKRFVSNEESLVRELDNLKRKSF